MTVYEILEIQLAGGGDFSVGVRVFEIEAHKKCLGADTFTLAHKCI